MNIRRDLTRENVLDIIPELKPLVGLEQPKTYHIYDAFEHSWRVFERMRDDTDIKHENHVLLAGLLHDIGKGNKEIQGINKRGEPSFIGHENVEYQLINSICHRLGIPDREIVDVYILIKYHMVPNNFTEKTANKIVKRIFGEYGTCSPHSIVFVTIPYSKLIKQWYTIMKADLLESKHSCDIARHEHLESWIDSLFRSVLNFSSPTFCERQ